MRYNKKFIKFDENGVGYPVGNGNLFDFLFQVEKQIEKTDGKFTFVLCGYKITIDKSSLIKKDGLWEFSKGGLLVEFIHGKLLRNIKSCIDVFDEVLFEKIS